MLKPRARTLHPLPRSGSGDTDVLVAWLIELSVSDAEPSRGVELTAIPQAGRFPGQREKLELLHERRRNGGEEELLMDIKDRWSVGPRRRRRADT